MFLQQITFQDSWEAKFFCLVAGKKGLCGADTELALRGLGSENALQVVWERAGAGQVKSMWYQCSS